MSRTPFDADQLDDAIDTVLEDGRGPVAADEDGLVVTARLLRRSLPRLHPSFSFEEHLAARLAVARRMELGPTTAAAVGAPTPIRAELALEPAAAVVSDGSPDRRRRTLVAGGAIASGVSIALPIAGAALVAWRRSRSGGMF